MKGSDDGVEHLGLLGFQTFLIVWYSKERVLETGPVLGLLGGINILRKYHFESSPGHQLTFMVFLNFFRLIPEECQKLC
jgi:hypothetical protein